MKKIASLFILCFVFTACIAQKNWFTLYNDSAALVTDAKSITAAFTKDIKKIKPSIDLDVKALLNTTPYLIYYYGEGSARTANLPKWDQVIEPQKQFFYEVGGSEAEGKKMFGLFFNGFYLPHELAHAVEHTTKGVLKGSYQEEFFANIVAMLWWKKQGRTAELKACYKMAKKVWAKLPKPNIPAGSSIEDYFTKNYEQASKDPYVYGYMQFKQFIMVYEDKSLTDFDSYMMKYLQ